MTGSEIALDTNQAIAVLNNRADTGTWIAALCVQHDLALATTDEHFLAVQGLRVIGR